MVHITFVGPPDRQTGLADEMLTSLECGELPRDLSLVPAGDNYPRAGGTEVQAGFFALECR